MNFNISAFTHEGTAKDSNQDCILVNGEVLAQGYINRDNQEHCFCFVADGVGGNRAGDFASQFVLENIKSLPVIPSSDWASDFHNINQKLLTLSCNKQELRGTASTLSGLIINKERFSIIHAGDSEMWLQRDDMFFKLTNDQVFNDLEKNSPLTSYFGGVSDNLRFDEDIYVRESLVGDTFLICSDGLFKSLSHKTVKSILNMNTDLDFKAQALLEECLRCGAEDNVSTILINRGE